MALPSWTYLPDVLEEHIEELGFLWNVRGSALRSHQHTMRSVVALEDRILAHLDGVLVTGDRALPRVEEGLSSDDPLAIFVAAFIMSHHHASRYHTLVMRTLVEAEGAARGALVDAASHSPLNYALGAYRTLLLGDDESVALAAARVLSSHRHLEMSAGQLQSFIHSENPSARVGGWQLVAELQPTLEGRLYSAAVRDDNADVRGAALYAGAWCGNPGVVVAARKLVADGDARELDVLKLLAILGTKQDVDLFATIAEREDLGARRMQLLGTFGSPAFMPLLLQELSNTEPSVAAAAGRAFEKMVGVNVDSTTSMPGNAVGLTDAFEAEFAEQFVLPDAEKARTHWDNVQAGLGKAQRLCHGQDMSRPVSAEAFAAFDMESRWETWLRSRFYGEWQGNPLDLAAFPQNTHAPTRPNAEATCW